jgi:hypothetical protein
MRRFHEIVTDLQSRTLSGDIQPQQLFSNQRSGQRRQNLATLKRVLGLLSGGDKVGILEELYSSHYVPSIAAIMDTSQRSCLETIRDRFNMASKSDRKPLLSLVANAYSAKFLTDLGFKFSSSLYASAKQYLRYFSLIISKFEYFLIFIHSFFVAHRVMKLLGVPVIKTHHKSSIRGDIVQHEIQTWTTVKFVVNQ